jgi:hypothetical protein
MLIDLVGNAGAGGDAYGDHAHGTVGPVGLSAVALVGLLLFRSAALQMGRSHAVDPAVFLARRFGTMSPLVPLIAVAVGGFATLVAMEFTEQLSELGRIEGVVDALGGNAAVGLAIVAGVATTITLVGLRSAGAVLRATVATVGALCAWIVVKAPSLVDDAAILRGVQRLRRRAATSTFIARSRGLRAPPLAIV